MDKEVARKTILALKELLEEEASKPTLLRDSENMGYSEVDNEKD